MNVPEIFDSMDYGPAPESAAEALAWLVDRGAIAGHYVDGRWGPLRDDFASNNPATGEKLAGVTKATIEEVDAAVKAARKAQLAWARKPGHERAKILYAIARGMQKHSRLLAVMETLDNGKPIRESRDIDIPLAIRHFLLSRGHGPASGYRTARPRSAGCLRPNHPVEFPTADAFLENRTRDCDG